MDTVYVPMCADYLHPGHINILRIAEKYGKVVVGLLTDEAMATYKRRPALKYEMRYALVSSLSMVAEIIPQDTLDFTYNLELLRPAYVVHGDDWKVGPQAITRLAVICQIESWGGKLIEPSYTSGISSSELQGFFASEHFESLKAGQTEHGRETGSG